MWLTGVYKYKPSIDQSINTSPFSGNRAGQKRKGPAVAPQISSGSSSSTAPKQRKLAESPRKRNTEEVSDEAERPTETLAAGTQSPRKRGRPPNPRTDCPPREAGQRSSQEGSPKTPRLRLAPLKIKDSGRRKKKQ